MALRDTNIQYFDQAANIQSDVLQVRVVTHMDECNTE